MIFTRPRRGSRRRGERPGGEQKVGASGAFLMANGRRTERETSKKAKKATCRSVQLHPPQNNITNHKRGRKELKLNREWFNWVNLHCDSPIESIEFTEKAIPANSPIGGSHWKIHHSVFALAPNSRVARFSLFRRRRPQRPRLM